MTKISQIIYMVISFFELTNDSSVSENSGYWIIAQLLQSNLMFLAFMVIDFLTSRFV